MKVNIDTDERGFDKRLARNGLGPRKVARTEKQIETSRLNGRKGKGPVTVAGKQRSSQNAVTHGLFARLPRQQLPIFCDRTEYDRVVNAVLAEFGCRTTMGAVLVQGLVRRAM